MKSNSEDNWKFIDDLRAACASLRSAVVVVETNDEKRFQQILTWKKSEKQSVYVYTQWSGLKVADRNGVLRKAEVDDDDFIASPMALIAKLLDRERGKIFVMKNILSENDLPVGFLNYLSQEESVLGRDNCIVVIVPSRTLLPPSLLERCLLLTPPASTARERRDLIARLSAEVEVKFDCSLLDEFVAATGGLNLDQTEGLAADMLNRFAAEGGMDMEMARGVREEIVSSTPLLRVERTGSGGFDRVGGYEAVKEMICESVLMPLREPERAARLGVSLPRGFILFGPPGTGKTMLAKAMADELGMPFITLSPENFMSSFLGQSERNLASALGIIEAMSPCVVFIDEIDRLGGRGESAEQDGNTNRRLFCQLLQWLGEEKRRAIVVGATNMPYLDQAFRREGRFDGLIPMLNPDLHGRVQILRSHLEKVRHVPHTLDHEDMLCLAERLVNWKGNMIEELVKRACRVAFRDGRETVALESFEIALDDYLVDASALATEKSKFTRMAHELTNSSRFLPEADVEVEPLRPRVARAGLQEA